MSKVNWTNWFGSKNDGSTIMEDELWLYSTTSTTTYCAFLRRAKQKIWRFCERKTKNLKGLRRKKICQICDAFRIATCGAPLIANVEWTFNHLRTFARYTTNNTLRSAQSLSTIAIFHPSQWVIILKTLQPLQYTEYRYKLWDLQHTATCVIWRLAFFISICLANLITNFYKTFRWWTYRKLQFELAHKVVKGLLEKEVLQKGFAMSSDSQNAIKKKKIF
jgi:hypothetical protein